MHGSVLQNKKYIKFANENTVEVITVSSLEKGIDAGDKKAGTYKETGPDGKEVEYLVSWPGLTLEDMKKLGSSKARSYNNTGGIPHVAIVNPWTLEAFDGWNGGSAGKIMDAVDEAKKVLQKEHGKGLSRKTLQKFRDDEADVRKELAAGDFRKAWTEYRKFQKKVQGEADPIVKMGEELYKDLLAATEKKLDEIEAMHGRGETKEAERELRMLARYLKDTPLEEKANELMKKFDPPEA